MSKVSRRPASTKKPTRARARVRSSVTTKSGNSIKINRTMSDRKKAKKAERKAAKALYLSSLPKNRWKRLLYRMHPKRVAGYWFSREGALMCLKIIGASFLICFFLVIGLFAYFRKELPQLKDISGDNLGGSISYYDSTGKVLLWQDYDAVKRIEVNSNQISPYMKQATVAIEDKGFYKEGAFDVRGILRAATHDAVGGGGSLQGGSTITQQLVKLNEGWTNDRTLTRKVKELILAVEIEREYSKDDILTGYLNIAPYGGIDYGVQTAAEDYFHTSAKDLTLPEAAMLAAIPQAPSYFSPYASSQYNPEVTSTTFSGPALIDRQQYILAQMQIQGYITKAQEAAAKKVNVLALVQPQANKYQNIVAPYFVLAAKQQLDQKYGSTIVNRGGWKVTTTLNLALQQNAENDVAANAKNVAHYGGNQEAMVAEDVQTGQVVAQVGGEDFSPTYPGGEINYAGTLISPGSSLKPFVYAALIQNNNNVGAGSYLYDSQDPIPGYPCTNKSSLGLNNNSGSGGNCLFDDTDQFPGPVTLRYALAGSRNVPAVKASYEVDPTGGAVTESNYTGYTAGDVKSVDKWISMANAAMGTSNAYACYDSNATPLTATASQQSQCYGDAAIGGGYVRLNEEVNGDTTLARLGQEIPQTYITNITDASGKTVYQWKQPKSTQVYSPDTAYIINNILDDPKATYLPTYQKFQNYDGWDIAVKTGTQNDSKNGLMTAWTTKYAVVGFVGSDTLTKQLAAGQFENMTEPITKTWLEQALTALHTKPVNWTQPTDVKVEPAYVQQYFFDYGAVFPGPSTDLFPSWYQAGGTAKKGTQETIDKVSDLLATSCTPALAKETVDIGGSSGKTNFDVDLFHGSIGQPNIGTGTASTQAVSTATDNVHNCNDSPPTISLTAPTNCTTNNCQITATVTQGTHPLTDPNYPDFPGTITFYLNGNKIHSATIPANTSPYSTTFSYSPTSTGTGTLTADVTDSVLYQGTDSATMSYSNAAPLSIANVTSTSGSINVSWTGGNGTVTATTAPGNYACSADSSADTCTITIPPATTTGSYAISLTDSDGDTASPTSVNYTSSP